MPPSEPTPPFSHQLALFNEQEALPVDIQRKLFAAAPTGREDLGGELDLGIYAPGVFLSVHHGEASRMLDDDREMDGVVRQSRRQELRDVDKVLKALGMLSERDSPEYAEFVDQEQCRRAANFLRRRGRDVLETERARMADLLEITRTDCAEALADPEALRDIAKQMQRDVQQLLAASQEVPEYLPANPNLIHARFMRQYLQAQVTRLEGSVEAFDHVIERFQDLILDNGLNRGRPR